MTGSFKSACQALLALVLALLLAACQTPAAVSPTAAPAQNKQAGNRLPPGFDVQGHRGARGLKPENTLPAFETALDLGVTTLELDLHYSADGVVVVWHDDDIVLSKCSVEESGPALGTSVSQLSFEQIQAFRCALNPDLRSFPGQDPGPTALASDDYRIPSLAQVFDFVERYGQSPEKTQAQRDNARQVQFNIETKRSVDDPAAIGDGFDGQNPGPFERAIVDLVEQRGLVDRVTIQSFDHRSLWAVHQLNPAIRLAALTSRQRPDLEAYAQQGASIWSPRYQDLTPSLLGDAHEQGLLVIPWTVNDLPTMERLIDLGVDGLITDRPDLLLAEGE